MMLTDSKATEVSKAQRGRLRLAVSGCGSPGSRPYHGNQAFHYGPFWVAVHFATAPRTSNPPCYGKSRFVLPCLFWPEAVMVVVV